MFACRPPAHSTPPLQDNEVTVDQRVLYVAYKWVHKYWPHRVGRGDPHVITLPAALWVEGQPVDLVLSAKIRMYNKAAHMLLGKCGAIQCWCLLRQSVHCCQHPM